MLKANENPSFHLSKASFLELDAYWLEYISHTHTHWIKLVSYPLKNTGKFWFIIFEEFERPGERRWSKRPGFSKQKLSEGVLVTVQNATEFVSFCQLSQSALFYGNFQRKCSTGNWAIGVINLHQGHKWHLVWKVVHQCSSSLFSLAKGGEEGHP